MLCYSVICKLVCTGIHCSSRMNEHCESLYGNLSHHITRSQLIGVKVAELLGLILASVRNSSGIMDKKIVSL